MQTTKHFNQIDTDRIIEMAWEDRTPFEAIDFQFNLKKQVTIELMRRELIIVIGECKTAIPYRP